MNTFTLARTYSHLQAECLSAFRNWQAAIGAATEAITLAQRLSLRLGSGKLSLPNANFFEVTSECLRGLWNATHLLRSFLMHTCGWGSLIKHLQPLNVLSASAVELLIDNSVLRLAWQWPALFKWYPRQMQKLVLERHDLSMFLACTRSDPKIRHLLNLCLIGRLCWPCVLWMTDLAKLWPNLCLLRTHTQLLANFSLAR